MAELRFPSGTATFLFTDIEGSTRLIEELGEEGYVASRRSRQLHGDRRRSKADLSA
jgi:class 3 adenylate cyclase